MPHHTPETLLHNLTTQGVPYVLHRHAAVMTVADGTGVTDHLIGAHIKNLFVKDKGGNLFLITALQERTIDLKTLGKHLGARDRLSFASPETLMEVLGVTPGSVSPLALINAAPGRLRVVLDSGISRYDAVLPHPLVNTQTAALAVHDLYLAIAHWGHQAELVDLGQFIRT